MCAITACASCPSCMKCSIQCLTAAHRIWKWSWRSACVKRGTACGRHEPAGAYMKRVEIQAPEMASSTNIKQFAHSQLASQPAARVTSRQGRAALHCLRASNGYATRPRRWRPFRSGRLHEAAESRVSRMHRSAHAATAATSPVRGGSAGGAESWAAWLAQVCRSYCDRAGSWSAPCANECRVDDADEVLNDS